MIIDNPVFQQTVNNLLVMLIGVFIIGIIQKGFLLPYMKVRISFGKYILVKIRAVNRDYFKSGEISDGFLLYKTKTGCKRIGVPDSSVFYKAMSVTWVDVDENSGAVVKPDFTAVTGFDPEKYDNLYKRTLYRPAANDNKEKLMFTLIILAIIVGVAACYLGYVNMSKIDTLASNLSALSTQIKQGFVIPK